MNDSSDRVRSGGRRRAAAFAGVLGLITFSAGISLVAQSGAEAAKGTSTSKVLVCHATNSLPKSYVTEYPANDSHALSAHQAHRDNPNKTWKASGWWNGTYYNAGDPKPDFIHSFTDANGVFHQEDGNITPSFCTAVMTPYRSVTPSVSFTDPDCVTASGSWVGQSVTGVAGYAKTSGGTNPGDSITVTATAAVHYTFSANPNVLVATMPFTHDYPLVTGCSSTSSTPTVTVSTTTTVTVSTTPTVTVSTTSTGTVPPPPTKPTVSTIPPQFRDPTCNLKDNTAIDLGGTGMRSAADLAATSDKLGVLGVDYEVVGTVAPGGTVTVVATAQDPANLPIGTGLTTSWTHTFPSVAHKICTKPGHVITEPLPTSAPDVVVPTTVHSGLESVPTVGSSHSVMRTLGLVLAGLGCVLMLGSLGLVRRAVTS